MSNTINFKGFIGIGIKQLSTNEFINYFSTNNNNNTDVMIITTIAFINPYGYYY